MGLSHGVETTTRRLKHTQTEQVRALQKTPLWTAANSQKNNYKKASKQKEDEKEQKPWS